MSRAEGAVRLLLFVAGGEPHSRRARSNIERIRTGLGSEVTLTVHDVLVDYRAALEEGVLVTPTLVIHGSGRRVTVLGDLSDEAAVAAALDRAGGSP